jgi:hypothetical protein
MASQLALAELPTVALSAVPNTDGAEAAAISKTAVRTAVFDRALPNVAAKDGKAAAMQRVLADPVKRAHVVGLAAEEDFVARNPKWNLTAASNAPQNDVWTRVGDELHGAQIKTHADGDSLKYATDMLKDDKAEHFLVPDDHLPGIRERITDHINRMKQRGNVREVEKWEEQLRRLKPLGRTYAALEQPVVSIAQSTISNAKIVRAAKTGLAGGAIILVLEGGSVIYRGASGELTPEQTREQLLEVTAKAGIVTLATGAVVLLGANPVGFTVLVVGGVSYLIADFAIKELRENWTTAPLTAKEIGDLLPQGWHLHDPASNVPLRLTEVKTDRDWASLVQTSQGARGSGCANTGGTGGDDSAVCPSREAVPRSLSAITDQEWRDRSAVGSRAQPRQDPVLAEGRTPS